MSSTLIALHYDFSYVMGAIEIYKRANPEQKSKFIMEISVWLGIEPGSHHVLDWHGDRSAMRCHMPCAGMK